jgi:hypothetical protein
MQVFFLKNHKLTRTVFLNKAYKIHKEFNIKLLYLYYTEKSFKKMMSNIKKIIALETFSVRHPVLRAEKPIENCHFNENVLGTTVHFDLYDTKICESYFIIRSKKRFIYCKKTVLN